MGYVNNFKGSSFISKYSCLLDILKARHSTRVFTQKLVNEADIRQIIWAGSLAPSSMNNQPWRFSIITDNETIVSLGELLIKSQWIKRCRTIIAVIMCENDSSNILKDMLSIGACIENMLLCATAMGIQSCLVGEFIGDSEKIDQLFRLDMKYKTVALIALGYENVNIKVASLDKMNYKDLML